jgi:thioredoxin-related protein
VKYLNHLIFFISIFHSAHASEEKHTFSIKLISESKEDLPKTWNLTCPKTQTCKQVKQRLKQELEDNRNTRTVNIRFYLEANETKMEIGNLDRSLHFSTSAPSLIAYLIGAH